MKKWLSILGVIGLTATSTTSLISCEKPNNNKNRSSNKPEQPWEGSRWKLINEPESEILDEDKTYIGLFLRNLYLLKQIKQVL